MPKCDLLKSLFRHVCSPFAAYFQNTLRTPLKGCFLRQVQGPKYAYDFLECFASCKCSPKKSSVTCKCNL